MNKHVAIVLDWFGPYSLEEAIRCAREDFDDGLYCLIGKTKHQKRPIELQYIGIANNLHNRISKDHEKIKRLSQTCEIWLGEAASFGIPGSKNKATNAQLDLAEWLHSYFLILPLNERKKENPPDTPATVLNRWWFKDYETPRQNRPHQGWPDVIDFTGKDFGAKVVWFGGEVERWKPDDF